MQENIDQLVKEKISFLTGKELATIKDDEGLNANLGLASLQFAQLIVSLEEEIGVDPFADLFSISDMKTVRDVVNAYSKTVGMGVQ